MDPYNDFLVKTLDIINFQGNREEWIQQFMQHAQQLAFMELLKTLPQDQQQTLTTTIQNPPAGKTPEQVLQEYFTPLDCSIALQEQILEEYKKFVHETMGTLTPEKQQELQAYLLPLINGVDNNS
jgi:hypothetical protein